MCAERVQRFLMAVILTVSMVLFAAGQLQFGVIIQTFVIAMILLWAFTDICPALTILRKIFGSCDKKEA